MQYRELGNTGMLVSEIGMGCEGFSENNFAMTRELFDLADVANYEKKIPQEWINEEGNGVLHDFIAYAKPLIQGETKLVMKEGLPRFARLKRVYAK